MSSRDKLIASMRNNPRNIRFEELQTLLLFFGFRERCNGTSHHLFTHPRASEPVPVPFARPIKAIYVKHALNMIDEVKEAYTNE